MDHATEQSQGTGEELEKNWTGRNKVELDAGGPKFVAPGESSRPHQASLESRFGLTGDFEILMAVEFSRSHVPIAVASRADVSKTASESLRVAGFESCHAFRRIVQFSWSSPRCQGGSGELTTYRQSYIVIELSDARIPICVRTNLLRLHGPL
jgi:hypothetical protein